MNIDDKPTTFRDDPPRSTCPDCGKAPRSTLSTDGSGTVKYTCPSGHTWTAGERTVRA